MSSHSPSTDISSESTISVTPPLSSPAATSSNTGASSPVGSESPVPTVIIESKSDTPGPGDEFEHGPLPPNVHLVRMPSRDSHKTTTSPRSFGSTNSVVSLVSSTAAKAAAKIDKKNTGDNFIGFLINYVLPYSPYFAIVATVLLIGYQLANTLFGEEGTGECSLPLDAIYNDQNTFFNFNFNVTDNSTVTGVPVLNEMIEVNTTMYEPNCAPLSGGIDVFERVNRNLPFNTLLQYVSVLLPWGYDLYQHFLRAHYVAENDKFVLAKGAGHYSIDNITSYQKIVEDFRNCFSTLNGDNLKAIYTHLNAAYTKFDNTQKGQSDLLDKATGKTKGKKEWEERSKDQLAHILGVTKKIENPKDAPAGNKVAPVVGEYKAAGASAGELQASPLHSIDLEAGFSGKEELSYLDAPRFAATPLFWKNVSLTALFFLPNLLEFNEKASEVYEISYSVFLPILTYMVNRYYPIGAEIEQIKETQEALVLWTKTTDLYEPLLRLSSNFSELENLSPEGKIEFVEDEEVKANLRHTAGEFSKAFADSDSDSDSDSGCNFSCRRRRPEPDTSPALG